MDDDDYVNDEVSQQLQIGQGHQHRIYIVKCRFYYTFVSFHSHSNKINNKIIRDSYVDFDRLLRLIVFQSFLENDVSHTIQDQ